MKQSTEIKAIQKKVVKILNGYTYDKGELETMSSNIENLQETLANLLVYLRVKKVLNIYEIEYLLDDCNSMHDNNLSNFIEHSDSVTDLEI